MERTIDSKCIPRKFRKLDKTFINHLKYRRGGFFEPFPKNTSFLGKEDSENIVLVLRRHWLSLIPTIVSVFVLLLLPFIVTSLTPSESRNYAFLFSVFLISILLSISLSLFAYVKWFYNVNIITDKRVVDIDFYSLFFHKMTEARLDKIEDITFKQVGVFANMLDVGTIYIQTAGTKSEIEFDGIHKPKEVQDILSDLLQSKKEGAI
ncbi:MAG: PH domain-containing protein [Candidatus Dojkabacteria bacterium]|jgi:membrane protein YdbS with pleckstrin-like domain|nr:PH domain-containing protein [Candidatus Dojkabacteria bacterium]